MQYLIRVTRHYYADSALSFPGRSTYIDSDEMPTYVKSWQYVKPYACRAEAMKVIRSMESEPHYKLNNESNRPTLTAVPETQWPEYVTG